MVYVDLNPFRVRMANTPETTDHTSIKLRATKAQQVTQPNHPNQQASDLMPFVGYPRENMPKGLPFRLTDYLELVDWSGRILREDKKGAIPPVLDRLNIDPKQWLYLTKHFESPFKGMVGSVFKLEQTCVALGYVRTPGLQGCKKFFT